MVLKRWVRPRPQKELAEILAAEYGISLFLAEVLLARGLESPAKANEYLDVPGELSDSLLFPDMEKAVVRIKLALSGREKVVVYGDYDCDGVCASSVLFRYLDSLDADVTLYIPSREGDGYGLNAAALRKLKEQGADLVITVDNGISAVEEAAFAKEIGLDLIITDHHRPGETLPDALAVVDAYRKDADMSFLDYAGVGVAYQLVRALSGDELPDELRDELLEITAVGTIGDVVPLKGENRRLVVDGLKRLSNSKNAGLAALLTVSGVKPGNVKARSVAFGMVPRINAAGRMGDALLTAELLLCNDVQRANEIAQELNTLNGKRQETEKRILDEAQAQLSKHPELLRERVLVLSGEGWDAGVIGIVAARLLERYGKPTVLLSVSGGVATGSVRSVDGFSVHKALLFCSGLLERHGGHNLAGGLTVNTENITAFREALNAYARNLEELPRAVVRIDRVLGAEDITVENAEALSLLEPFGQENPEPVFLLEDAQLERIVPLSGGKHTKLVLRKNGHMVEALCFGTASAEFPYPVGFRLNALVSLEVNEFAGRRSPSLRVKEFRPAGLDETVWFQAELLKEAIHSGEGFNVLELQNCTLCREEMSLVYRGLKRVKDFCGDLTVLYFRTFCHKIEYLKFFSAAYVLKELGLIAFSETEEYITVTENPKNVSLTDSKLFCVLQK